MDCSRRLLWLPWGVRGKAHTPCFCRCMCLHDCVLTAAGATAFHHQAKGGLRGAWDATTRCIILMCHAVVMQVDFAFCVLACWLSLALLLWLWLWRLAHVLARLCCGWLMVDPGLGGIGSCWEVMGGAPAASLASLKQFDDVCTCLFVLVVVVAGGGRYGGQRSQQPYIVCYVI